LINLKRVEFFIDLSDFVFFIGHHQNLTGIQRVQANFVRGLQSIEDLTPHYICWNRRLGAFDVLDSEYLLAILADFDFQELARSTTFDKRAAQDGVLPRSRPLDIPADPTKAFTVLLLGSAWVIEDYFASILDLKRTYAASFVMTVHDLIPIYAANTCDSVTTKVVREYLVESSQFVNLYICVSNNTCKDLLRFFDQLDLARPSAVVVTSGLPTLDPARAARIMSKPTMRDDGPFVLFVSTIEGRKNHILAYEVWERLSQARGLLPRLVCVGRQGRGADEFLVLLESSGALGGRIEVLSNVSDGELEWLYARCLFTIYPSLYEGWGLPITESLARGKLCVASNTSAMPEAGGDLVLYADPHDPNTFFEVISQLLDDPDALGRRTEEIHSRFAARGWDAVAADYLAAMEGLVPDPSGNYVSIELGREYMFHAAPRSRASLRRPGESDVQGLLMPPSLSPKGAADGFYLHGTGRWMRPEPWGTWLGFPEGSLEFWWDGEPMDVVIGLLGGVLNAFAERNVRLGLNGRTAAYRGRACAKNRDLRIFLMPLRRGLNRLMIGVDLTHADHARSVEIDKRGLMWGAVSIVFLDPKDATGCQALVESPYRFTGS
jgi:glycosyltransferase involved in cell wall biosynthesis